MVGPTGHVIIIQWPGFLSTSRTIMTDRDSKADNQFSFEDGFVSRIKVTRKMVIYGSTVISFLCSCCIMF